MTVKVKAEKVGNRIHVDWSTPNRGDWMATKDRVKGIIGARFIPGQKCWGLPLDMETCRRLRDNFPGDSLDIGPQLWAWAAVEREREGRLHSLVNVSDIDVLSVVELPRVSAEAPTMWAAMKQRPYQAVAALYMAQALRCLNGDQPGIGKTIETLAALVERGVRGPVLILAPKTSCLVVWEAEIAKWFAGDVSYTITQTAGLSPVKREEAYELFKHTLAIPDAIHFLIANAEQAGIKKETVCPADICDGDEDWCPELDKHKNTSTTRRPFLHQMTWNAIIADETHKWLINTRGKSASQVGYGFTRLKVVDDGPMYALSGTPLKGKPWNLFGTLNWMWSKVYTSKWRFIESFWKVEEEEKDIGRRGTITVKNIRNEWKSDKDKEAFFRSLNTVMIRRTKAELRAINPAWMPPEKRYHDVYVPMSGSQATHYRQMEKNARVQVGEQVLTATGVLAEMTRLKQFASCDGVIKNGTFAPTLPSGKFNWILQFLEERGIEEKGDLSDDVRKVVLATPETQVIKLWSAELTRLGIANVMITGETKDRERAQNTKQFQEDPSMRVCLINTNAGGVSITLDAADDMVIAQETWVPDEQEQVEDRVHRASNVTHQVDIWYLRSAGTIEEDIAKANYDKAESNHVVLDAQRGLRFAAERFGVKIEEEAS